MNPWALVPTVHRRGRALSSICEWACRWRCAVASAWRWRLPPRHWDGRRLDELAALGAEIGIAITARRAEALGVRLAEGGVARLDLPCGAGIEWIASVCDPTAAPLDPPRAERRPRRRRGWPARARAGACQGSAAAACGAGCRCAGRSGCRGGPWPDGGGRRRPCGAARRRAAARRRDRANAARRRRGVAPERLQDSGRRRGALRRRDRPAKPGRAGADADPLGLLHRRRDGFAEMRLRPAAAGGDAQHGGRWRRASLSQPGGAGDRPRQQDPRLQHPGPGLRHLRGQPPSRLRGR